MKDFRLSFRLSENSPALTATKKYHCSIGLPLDPNGNGTFELVPMDIPEYSPYVHGVELKWKEFERRIEEPSTRLGHLRWCIEALERDGWAVNSAAFVAAHFPPAAESGEIPTLGAPDVHQPAEVV